MYSHLKAKDFSQNSIQSSKKTKKKQKQVDPMIQYLVEQLQVT